MKKNLTRRLLFVSLIVIVFFLVIPQNSFSKENEDCFSLCPWKVGQFAEYQIIGFYEAGEEDRYKVSIVGKELIAEKDFFWLRLDLSSDRKKEITLKALVRPLSSQEFALKPELYISEGLILLFKNARKLIISLNDGKSYEVPPKDFLNHPDPLKGTFYKNIPDEINKIDYLKMRYNENLIKVRVLAGTFDCYHFGVTTSEFDSFTDEGFDMWRSPQVPLLGIVKMEFSKTESIKKWNHKYNNLLSEGNWLSRLYTYFFIRRVPGSRELKDTFVMNLVDCSKN